MVQQAKGRRQLIWQEISRGQLLPTGVTRRYHPRLRHSSSSMQLTKARLEEVSIMRHLHVHTMSLLHMSLLATVSAIACSTKTTLLQFADVAMVFLHKIQ